MRGSGPRCLLLSASTRLPLPLYALLYVLDELVRWPLLPFLLKILVEKVIAPGFLYRERLSFLPSDFRSLFFLTALRLYPLLPLLDV